MLCFVDLESTGLDADTDLILELGIVVTDPDLTVLASASWVVHYPQNAIDRRLDGNDYVTEMHTRSGLLDEVRASSYTREQVESFALNFLDQSLCHPGDGAGPMCGSSVHFDRAFLKRHMPRLEDRWHYRNLDWSSIREAAKLWTPHVMDDLPPVQGLHRAVPDLGDTLALAGHLRSRLFGGAA